MKLLNERFFCFIKCYDVVSIQLLRRKTVITDIIFYDCAVFGYNYNLTLMFVYKYKCADGASQCITPFHIAERCFAFRQRFAKITDYRNKKA